MPANKVLIIGAGALGAFYGSLLAKAGAEVAMVCRSDYAHVLNTGFVINSYQWGQYVFKPHQVLRTVQDYQDTADYVVLCTKVLPELNRVELLRPVVAETSTIVFIQNGVAIEAELSQAFPEHEIISGLAFICCNRIEPGKIEHLAYGRLTLGSVKNVVSPATEQLVDLFQQAGATCVASANIITERWVKCLWNAAFNPLSVLSGGLSTLAIIQTQEQLVRHIMLDVLKVANACGYRLGLELIETNIANTHAMPAYKTSMLLDYERGQPMETEAILGNAVRAGQAANIETPYLATLYALMKLTELRLSN